MPLSLKELEKEYEENTFFTSDRRTIEYLLRENLDVLEEYALLIHLGKSCLFTPEAIPAGKIEQKVYCGYSNSRYQNKIKNIQNLLDKFLSAGQVEVMKERADYIMYFKSREVPVKDVTDRMMKQARIKNEEQAEAVERSVLCCQAAYQAIRANYSAAKDELDIWKDAVAAIRKQTGHANEMVFDLLAGVRTASVSGFPQSYIPRRNDTLIVDLLPRERGVFADTTRTYFIGEPDRKQKDVYAVLLEALERGKEKLKPGMPVKEIYREIKSSLGIYGDKKHFPHHAGHGLGIGYYDAPFLLEEEEELLEEGMVIALEPGIYLPGQFGMRIEDDYLITKKGAKKLGNIPLAMEEFICE